MRKVTGHWLWAWARRPQALVGVVVLCLCVGALGSLSRVAHRAPITYSDGPDSRLVRPLRASVDCDTCPCIALTFDDGPNPTVTPQVLDILARQHVRATFFVVGVHVPGNEALLRREYAEGHEIGNHSWSHPDLSKLSPEEAQSQIEMTQKVIAGTGVPAPKILRPPYGAVNEMLAAHNHLTIVRWNTDPEDWLQKDPTKIDTQLMAHVRPGSI